MMPKMMALAALCRSESDSGALSVGEPALVRVPFDTLALGGGEYQRSHRRHLGASVAANLIPGSLTTGRLVNSTQLVEPRSLVKRPA